MTHRSPRLPGETGETHLHLLGKAALSARHALTLPAMTVRGAGFAVPVAVESDIDCDAVAIEVTRGAIRPDALVTFGAAELAVEFTVTHAVSPEKAAIFRACGLSAIEIDLAHLWDTPDPDDQIDAILHLAPRRWVYNRVIEGVEIAVGRHLRTRGNLALTADDIAGLARRQLAAHGPF